MHYEPIELDFLRALFEDPDTFDPERLVRRHEDGQWDIEFDIRADLKRRAYCDVNQRLIVHDQLRVGDVARLMLQTLVWPSTFSYAAHVVRIAADILIAHARTDGAWVLIDTFFETAENFGLREALSIPMTVRISDFYIWETQLENAVQAFVLGHEIGHYLVHSAGQTSASKDDVELQCDAVGLELSLLYDEKEFFRTVGAAWDGPEPLEHSTIGGVWRMFEHFATALFWGDALRRRTEMCVSGESDDPFPLARRRTEAIITKFRSSDAGRSEQPLRDLSLMALQESFLKIDVLVTRTIDCSDDRFSVRRPSDLYAMAGDSIDLKQHWSDRLLSLGFESSIGNVIIPQAGDHPGRGRWLEVYEDNTMPVPEPHRDRGSIVPGEEFRHRYFRRWRDPSAGYGRRD